MKMVMVSPEWAVGLMESSPVNDDYLFEPGLVARLGNCP